MQKILFVCHGNLVLQNPETLMTQGFAGFASLNLHHFYTNFSKSES